MKIAIIDDEQDARFVLKNKLEKADFSITTIEEADGVLSGYQLINTYEPDLIFLDIKMYDGTGFDLIRQLDKSYPVIFVTAYDEYAIKAIKHRAIDYLLKPIKQESLNEALDQFQSYLSEYQPQALLSKLKSKPVEKIVVGNLNGFEVLAAEDIYFFESNNQYTHVRLENSTFTSSKGLIYFEDLLLGSQFIRIHNRHLVNTSKIKKYKKGDGGTITLDNGQELPVSRKFKPSFLEFFKNLQ